MLQTGYGIFGTPNGFQSVICADWVVNNDLSQIFDRVSFLKKEDGVLFCIAWDCLVPTVDNNHRNKVLVTYYCLYEYAQEITRDRDGFCGCFYAIVGGMISSVEGHGLILDKLNELNSFHKSCFLKGNKYKKELYGSKLFNIDEDQIKQNLISISKLPMNFNKPEAAGILYPEKKFSGIEMLYNIMDFEAFYDFGRIFIPNCDPGVYRELTPVKLKDLQQKQTQRKEKIERQQLEAKRLEKERFEAEERARKEKEAWGKSQEKIIIDLENKNCKLSQENIQLTNIIKEYQEEIDQLYQQIQSILKRIGDLEFKVDNLGSNVPLQHQPLLGIPHVIDTPRKQKSTHIPENDIKYQKHQDHQNSVFRQLFSIFEVDQRYIIIIGTVMVLVLALGGITFVLNNKSSDAAPNDRQKASAHPSKEEGKKNDNSSTQSDNDNKELRAQNPCPNNQEHIILQQNSLFNTDGTSKTHKEKVANILFLMENKSGVRGKEQFSQDTQKALNNKEKINTLKANDYFCYFLK